LFVARSAKHCKTNNSYYNCKCSFYTVVSGRWRDFICKKNKGKLIARNYQRKKKVYLKLNIKPMSKRNWEEAKPWLLGRPVGTLHQK
jgi:hypothetical protein